MSEKAVLLGNVNGRAEYGGKGNCTLPWLTLCWYVVTCCLYSVQMCSAIVPLSGEVAGIYIRKPVGLHGIMLTELFLFLKVFILVPVLAKASSKAPYRQKENMHEVKI